jgi:hypothetical protein
MMAVPYGSGRGRTAASNYQTLQALAGGGAALVQWRLESGRTHQIRWVDAALHHHCWWASGALDDNVPGLSQVVWTDIRAYSALGVKTTFASGVWVTPKHSCNCSIHPPWLLMVWRGPHHHHHHHVTH